MGRPRGTLFTSSNFEPIVKAPLDARQKVDYYEDLTNPATWEDFNGNVWLYKGTLVLVTNDPSSGLYWLNDPDNYTNPAHWVQVIAAPFVDVSIGVKNVGGGPGTIYAGTDASGYIRLRTIDGSGATIVTQVGDQIIIDTSVSSDAGIYNTTLDPSLAMPNPVGGIPADTTVADLKGDTFIKLFDDLLFPTVEPTYVSPNNSFVDNQGPYEEIGTSIDITFNAGFSRGQILVSGNFQDYRSGLPNTYTYTGTGIAGSVSSTSLTDSSILYGYTVLIGVQSWTNTVSYDAGPQPYDNKGNPVDSPLPAGTTSAKTVSFEGVYPIYATISNIADPNEKLLPLNYGMLSPSNNIQISLPAESGGNKQSFDIAQSWEGAPTNRPLQGVEQYDPNFDVWNALNFSSFTKTPTTHGAVSYWRYTYNGATIGARLIRLKFS